MAGIDFKAVRAAVSMQQVLELLGFVPSYRNGDQYRGPCPIHHSRSASSRSFSLHLSKNAFRCFTCGAAGNQLDLWSQVHGLPLFDATIDLCHRLQLSVPFSDNSFSNREEEPVTSVAPKSQRD